MDLIACPDPACGAPAEIIDRWAAESTDGPLEQVKTRCLARHIFTPLVASLRPTPQAVERIDVPDP